MKLLLDENLSYRLIKHLKRDTIESVHANMLGLGLNPDDQQIFKWAMKNGIDWIVSKDKDFLELISRLGSSPKLIYLKVGNLSTRKILAYLVDHLNAIESWEKDVYVISGPRTS
ncbi:MAG: DUF5615 family PIN-like protein [Bacteroidota bacterium]